MVAEYGGWVLQSGPRAGQMRATKGQGDRFIQTANAPTGCLKRMIFKIVWRHYAVQGGATARSREAALALIANLERTSCRE